MQCDRVVEYPEGGPLRTQTSCHQYDEVILWHNVIVVFSSLIINVISCMKILYIF